MDADTLGAIGLVLVAFSNLVLWYCFVAHLHGAHRQKRR